MALLGRWSLRFVRVDDVMVVLMLIPAMVIPVMVVMVVVGSWTGRLCYVWVYDVVASPPYPL